MGSQDQCQWYGGVGLGRLPQVPVTMQSLRERIGGLKAATNSASLPSAADCNVEMRYIGCPEDAHDGGSAHQQFAGVDRASQNENAYLQRKKTSWETELDEYLSATSDAAAVSDLKGRLKSPEAWLRFLQIEESARKLQGASSPGQQVGIGRLYEWATKAIPRSQNISNEDYLRVWIGYAKQQMETSEEDARQVFKYLKSHHVGHSLASLYEEWALFEIAAGQPQKALQKVQEGIRQQATPAGRLEMLQAKILASLPAAREGTPAVKASPSFGAHLLDSNSLFQSSSRPRKQTAAFEHPSPGPPTYGLDRPSVNPPHQTTPSADQVRQQQSTPLTYRQQPFQPSLQSIPSPAASLSTPSRAVSQSTPLAASLRSASVSKKPEGLRQEERVASQQVLETAVVGGVEACKGGYSTPHGKATSSTSGPTTAENTTVLGMPTPSFGLGTGTFGKGVLSGGFKFDETAHSVAGSSYTSQDTGRETGYGHTSHSVGGRSSIGSSFRWQPSPSSLTTRQVTTSVSSGGSNERSRSAQEGPTEQVSLAEERKGAGAEGVAQEKTVEGLSKCSPGNSDDAVKDVLGSGQVGMGKSALSKEWLPLLRTDSAETNFEGRSSGGSVRPTETVQLPAENLPAAGGTELAEERNEGGVKESGGTPLPSVGKLTEAPSGMKPGPAAKSSTVCRTPEVATSATAAAGGVVSRERPSTPSNLSNNPNPAFVRLVPSTGLERPQWMREPNRKLAPTLSPVEERSRERASSAATSSKSGSKSSGNSSVKSAVTSRGDEETVSLSKPVGLAAVPLPEKGKTVASATDAVSKAGAAEKQGKQLRRLGLSGRARRVAGPDDAPSSAESTEELAPLDNPPKEAVPQVKRQARELPTDEELLQKLEGPPKPALNQSQEMRASQESSKPGVVAARVAPAIEVLQRKVVNGSQELVGLGKGVPDSNGGMGGTGTPLAAEGSHRHQRAVVEQVGGGAKAVLPQTAVRSVVTPQAQTGPSSPKQAQASGTAAAKPARQPSNRQGDLQSAPSNPLQEPARLPEGPNPVSLEPGRPAKSLIPGGQDAPSGIIPQTATPQPPKAAPAQVAQAPVSVRQPSPRPSQPPHVPPTEQRRSDAPVQRGLSQATPTQGPHQAGVSPAPHVSARSRSHQKDSADVLWVNGKRYQKLRCVGKGGSSKVYKVIGPERGEYALKRVELTENITETRQGFIAEIDLLKRLQKRRNIIRYIDSEVGKDAMCVVLEYGEIDLAALLKKEEEKAKEKGHTCGDGSTCVDENFIRSKWQQMLDAVHSVHQERIVHKDLKPANFLSVMGELKLIDFGISKRMVDDSTFILPPKMNIGTPSYMSPESLQDPGPNVRVSRPSDVWSLGCILFQMAYGKTPIGLLSLESRSRWMMGLAEIPLPPLRNPHLLDAIKQCLKYNPEDRITIPELLCHPFLRPDLLPVPSPAPSLPVGGVALTEQQIQSLLAMANNLDLQMLRQLAATSGPGLAAVLQQAAAPRAVPPPPAPPRAPPPPPPPPPAAKKPRAPLRAPLQPVKRPAQVENRQQGGGLQGSIAAQVAEIAAARSKRMQNASGQSVEKGTGVSAGGVAGGMVVLKVESKGRRLFGGSVGSGKENKENVDGHQMLLQQKLASRRKVMEDELTGNSTANISFA